VSFIAFKEIAKLESKLDYLGDALLNYKANMCERDFLQYKDMCEKRIAEMYFQLQLLSDHFSYIKINEYLECLIKESEGSGDK
jgi:hypothetical protein